MHDLREHFGLAQAAEELYAAIHVRMPGRGPRDPRGGHHPALPLKHRNLNLLSRYSFTASTPAVGALLPLSEADALELDEDDEGAD
ncbi:hypothetical protein GCM10018780_77460 [Streptomyces lanatus]|nr:hypothetical protein GCM10018780_77460 [Streptomyces lanatus]